VTVDYKFTAQSPLAAGTQLTTANAALPDQPNLVTAPAGGATITFVASGTAPGTKALKVTNIASTVNVWGFSGFTPDATNPNKLTARFLVLFEAIPSADTSYFRISSSGGGTNLCDVLITSNAVSKLVMTVGGADTATAPVSGTNILVANTWYDVEIGFENVSITTGTFFINVRNLAGTLLSAVTTGAAQNNTTTVPATVRLGKTNTIASFINIQYKYLTIRSGASSGLSTPGANTPPVVSAIARKVQAAGLSTSFTASATDPEGDTLTYSWVITKPDGTTLTTGVTGATTATVTIPNQTTAGTYTVAVTVSDGTTPVTVTTYLLVQAANGSPARPSRVLSNTGSWAAGGDAASILAGLTDPDGSGFIISPDAPAGNSIIVQMEAPASGHASVSFYVNWVDSTTGLGVTGATGTFTGQVFQGTTPLTGVKIFTNTTNAPTLVSFDFSSGEDATLAGDLTDIRIELTATQ